MADTVDWAQEIESAEREASIRRHLTALRELNEQRRDGLGLAICVDCGDRISPKRILAIPHAVRCVGCQDNYERGGGQSAARQ